MTREPFTIGLIGTGGILPQHLDGISSNPDYTLTSVCDLNEAVAKQVARQCNATPFTDYRHLLEAGPDVVALNIPHHLHCPVALEAFEASCHVLVEKPLAIRLEELQTMAEAANKAGKVLFGMDSAYWKPQARCAREMVQRGQLGAFVSAHVPNHRFYFTDHRPEWFLQAATSGGGQFMNIGVHRLALTRTILGDAHEEASVLASVARLDERYDIEASTNALVLYAEGQSVVYEEFGDYQSPKNLHLKPRFTFKNGMLGLENDHVWTSDRDGRLTRHPIDNEAYAAPYAQLYAEAIKAMRNQPHYPTCTHSMQDVRVALACYASAKQGRQIDLKSDF